MKKVSINLAIASGILLAAAMTLRAQPLTMNTLAGHAVQGSADGLASYARFNHPNSVTTDGAGNIYVADTENSTIRKITPGGGVSTFAGAAGNTGSLDGTGTNAQFYGPQGIAADAAGNLYVADTANATIRKIIPAGVVTTLAGLAGNFNSFDGVGTNAQFYHPEALALDSAGNVYIADAWNHTIRKVTPPGLVSTLAGLAGYFGAADGTNSKARFHRPSGIAVDAATNLFVTDFFNHTIRKITPGGTVSTIAGLAGIWGDADGTNSGARFFQPQGITVDHAGNLVVVDSGNQILRKITGDGTNWIVTTIAGLTGSAGNAEGTGSAAQFYFPAGVARDDAGYLYVADSGNNTIRTERVVPPTLQITAAANLLVLSWPTTANGFVLETATTIAAGAVWSQLTNAVVLVGDSFVLTNNATAAALFYRLHKP